MVERCPDKTEVEGPIPSTLTSFFPHLHPIKLYFILIESRRGFIFMIDEKQNPDKGPWWKPGMQLMGEISTWIIVPIVSALIFGKMLDNHFGTKPIIFLIFAGSGFLITCFGIFRMIKNYTKKLQEIEKEK